MKKEMTIKQKISRKYNNMMSRCKHNPYYNGEIRLIKPLLTHEDILFLWKRDSAELMKEPSLDRINPKGDYILRNCRIIELQKNKTAKNHFMKKPEKYCKNGHLKDGENLIIDKRGHRICRICRNKSTKKSKDKILSEGAMCRCCLKKLPENHDKTSCNKCAERQKIYARKKRAQFIANSKDIIKVKENNQADRRD